jgi:hypothetical protein
LKGNKKSMRPILWTEIAKINLAAIFGVYFALFLYLATNVWGEGRA